MTNNPKCPYKDKKNCVHRYGKNQHSKTKDCIYKNQTKCHLYIEWLELKKSCSRMANNRYGAYNEGIDDL